MKHWAKWTYNYVYLILLKNIKAQWAEKLFELTDIWRTSTDKQLNHHADKLNCMIYASRISLKFDHTTWDMDS